MQLSSSKYEATPGSPATAEPKHSCSVSLNASPINIPCMHVDTMTTKPLCLVRENAAKKNALCLDYYLLVDKTGPTTSSIKSSSWPNKREGAPTVGLGARLQGIANSSRVHVIPYVEKLWGGGAVAHDYSP